MAKKEVPPKKKSKPLVGSLLDGIGYVIGQAALPIPDFIFSRKEKKQKK